MFGDTVPVYRSPAELGELCRYYLSHPEERRRLAFKQQQRVQGHTFDARAADMMAAIQAAHSIPA